MKYNYYVATIRKLQEDRELFYSFVVRIHNGIDILRSIEKIEIENGPVEMFMACDSKTQAEAQAKESNTFFEKHDHKYSGIHTTYKIIY